MGGEGTHAPDDPDAPQTFSYRRSIAPMLWVFVTLSAIELLVVHFLISFWSPTAALILSLLTLASILWLVLLIRSMGRLPVVLDQRRLVMRVGKLRSVELELERIEGLRSDFDAAALQAPGVANLALIAWPNIWVELRQPIEQRGRKVRAVAHKLDEPRAFVAALNQRLLANRPQPAMEAHARR